MLPYLDKTVPPAWKAVSTWSQTVTDEAVGRGLSSSEIELIKMRVSQLNGCVFCLDLHGRRARKAGVTPQKLDVLPAWRDSSLFTDREAALLGVSEAATRMPLDAASRADLAAAHATLGDELFAAAEWVAVTIGVFNRLSILSEHPVRPRDAAEQLT